VAGLFGQSEQILLRLLNCTLISTRPGSRVEIYTPARALLLKCHAVLRLFYSKNGYDLTHPPSARAPCRFFQF